MLVDEVSKKFVDIIHNNRSYRLNSFKEIDLIFEEKNGDELTNNNNKPNLSVCQINKEQKSPPELPIVNFEILNDDFSHLTKFKLPLNYMK
jgi:hypothetical protein